MITGVLYVNGGGSQTRLPNFYFTWTPNGCDRCDSTFHPVAMFVMILCVPSSSVCQPAFLLSNWCSFLLLNLETVRFPGENLPSQKCLRFHWRGKWSAIQIRWAWPQTGIYFSCTANVEKIFVTSSYSEHRSMKQRNIYNF